MSKSTTPSGLPYPNPDDPVRDGSQRIRELAEALEPRNPYKVMVINGNYVVNSDGYFAITVPGSGIAAAMIGYIGIYGPIIVNGFNAGGPGMGFKVYNVVSGDAIPNTTVPLMGALYYF